MDPLRRGALMKAGRMIAGVAGAAALSGSRGGQLDTATGMNNLNKYNSGMTAQSESFGKAIEPDPAWQKRGEVEGRLYKQIHAMEDSRRWKISDSAYLETLKSPSQHWKMSVMLDRERRRQTAIQTLRDQISKLYETPMEKLEQFANDALAGFMAEWNKP